jgi:AcrR family transcriptional regulator
MNEVGLEAFTFKKLAARAGCTEVTAYHYFPNKQRMLQYYFQLYWLWLLAMIHQQKGAYQDPLDGLQSAIDSLAGSWPGSTLQAQLDPYELRRLVVAEGSKSYLHKNVDKDNALKLFKPYKDLVAEVAQLLQASAPEIEFPRSFATTLVEMAHSLEFAMHHLPSLTELSTTPSSAELSRYLTALTHRHIRSN